MKLTSIYSRVLKRIAATVFSRAWLISPDGEVFPCGQDHSQCIEIYPELLQGRHPSALVKEGWGQVGYFDYAESVYLQVREPTEPVFRSYSSLVSSLSVGPKFRVEVILPNDTLVFTYKDFRKFESLADMQRFGKIRH